MADTPAHEALRQCRDALREAAQSLRTIADNAGKRTDTDGNKNYLQDCAQVRGYANSRATVADAYLAAADAALSGPAGVAPAGWQLVPVDPTDDMLRIFTGFNFCAEFNPKAKAHREGVYRCILQAAPQPAPAALSVQADRALNAAPVADPAVPSAAVLLAEQVLHMDMVTDRGLRARDLARQVLDKAHHIHEGECAHVLRNLASYLGAGGYNATAVDPAVFRDKIMWGIEQINSRQAALVSQVERAGCECAACLPHWAMPRMILCAICGNKRCPHAADHRHACTNSNEPGQPGSSYPALPVAPTPDQKG